MDAKWECEKCGCKYPRYDEHRCSGPNVLAEYRAMEKRGQEQRWQPIDTAPHGVVLLLYFPEEQRYRGSRLPEWFVAERYPVTFSRKPTHWMPLPAPPDTATTSTEV